LITRRRERTAEPGRPPTTGRLVVMCCWSALLASAGVVVAVRGLLAIITNAPPWFGPTLGAFGLTGTALTAAGLFSARRGRIGYVLLGTASLMLVATILVTVLAI
jgi:hypothetical protein